MGHRTIFGRWFQAVAIENDPAAPLVVRGQGFRGIDTFNRSANVTPYAVGQVVGAAGAGGGNRVLTLTDVPRGSHLLIESLTVRMSGTALPVGMAGGFRVFLSSAPMQSADDGAAFAALATERGASRGYIDVPVLELIGGGYLERMVDYVGRRVQLAPGENRLWYELVTLSGNAFTPVSAAAVDVVVNGTIIGA